MEVSLYSNCAAFRRNLETLKKEQPDLFGTFPSAYCADASLWLCDYLISRGYKRDEFRFRARDPFLDNLGNHVWLYYSGFDIDITADQFNKHGYNFPQVIVSNNNAYYSEYDEQWCKKEYSAHSYSPICILFEQWGNKYDIVYERLGLKFDINSISIAV